MKYSIVTGVDPKVSRREINLDTDGLTQLSEGTDGYKRLYYPTCISLGTSVIVKSSGTFG